MIYDEAVTQRRTVFISAGHSNADPGAAANGVTEAGIVLEIRDLICTELDGRIIYHRDGEAGDNMPLSDAARMAAQADIAVEIHCNAATPAATGVETLSKPTEYPFAAELIQAVTDTLSIRSRGTKPEGSGQHSRLAFVSDGGGIILELFFLTNTSDLAAYQQNKNALAAELADVLVAAACRDA